MQMFVERMIKKNRTITWMEWRLLTEQINMLSMRASHRTIAGSKEKNKNKNAFPVYWKTAALCWAIHVTGTQTRSLNIVKRKKFSSLGSSVSLWFLQGPAQFIPFIYYRRGVAKYPNWVLSPWWIGRELQGAPLPLPLGKVIAPTSINIQWIRKNPVGRIKSSDLLKCRSSRMLCKIFRVAHKPVDLRSKSRKQTYLALFELHLIIGWSL